MIQDPMAQERVLCRAVVKKEMKSTDLTKGESLVYSLRNFCFLWKYVLQKLPLELICSETVLWEALTVVQKGNTRYVATESSVSAMNYRQAAAASNAPEIPHY
jgi:hypothetical protein